MDFSATRLKQDISAFTFLHVVEGNGIPVQIAKLIPAIDSSDFELQTQFNDRHSYFLTAQEWAKRLESNRAALTSKYGERLYRLFHLYLSATAFDLGCDGSLEAHRLVLRRTRGKPSHWLGL